MKDIYFRHKHIEMRKSPIHGLGIFATANISPGEVLEEVPFLPVPDGVLTNFIFRYPRNGTPGAENIPLEAAIPLGYACIYNHSNTPNAAWYTDIATKTFVFHTLSRIFKDQEIRTYYGDASYWACFPEIKVL